MKFLNKKERVLDIKLTQYGKYILSKGNFRPIYYAFFDDDIIYDRQYAAPTTGSTWSKEPQNEIEDRIKEDLRLETQYVFSGIEENLLPSPQQPDQAITAVKSNPSPALGPAELAQSYASQGAFSTKLGSAQIARAAAATGEFKIAGETQVDKGDDIIAHIDPRVQQTPTKFYNASYALGRADLGTNKKSAWSVSALQGRISSSYTYKEETNNKKVNIPQLNMIPIAYKSEVQKGNPSENFVEDSYTTSPFSDGNYLRIYEDSIVLEIDEVNSPFENENFDIEVYEITTGSVNTAGGAIEHLIPLYFSKPLTYIKDNILLDEPENSNQYDIDETYVEHYFNIRVDSEIDQATLCKLMPADKAQGIFSSRMLDCESIKKQQKLNSRDYYRSDVTIDDLEDC